jgi:replication-associated recombination protein RarA
MGCFFISFVLASAHDLERNISGQEYMLTPNKVYEPKEIGAEKILAERLHEWQDHKENKNKEK